MKIYPPLSAIVLSSFAPARRLGYTDRMNPNQILLMIGDWPLRLGEAALGFCALVILLLLAITVAVMRAGRRGADSAMTQAMRADALEERLG